jgi:hypothetical protein
MEQEKRRVCVKLPNNFRHICEHFTYITAWVAKTCGEASLLFICSNFLWEMKIKDVRRICAALHDT